jgi:hypothetical protein
LKIKTLHIILIFISNCALLTFRAQDFTASPTRHIFKIDFKLPTGIRNLAFKSFLSGIVDADFNYQYTLLDDRMAIGAGIKYTHWQIITTKFQNMVVNGQWESYSPFAVISYKKSVSDNAFFEYELKGGYAFTRMVSNRIWPPAVREGWHIEPKAGFFLKANDLSAVGITANYVLIGSNFTPDQLGLARFQGFSDADNQKIYQYFSIGLSAYLILPSYKR